MLVQGELNPFQPYADRLARGAVETDRFILHGFACIRCFRWLASGCGHLQHGRSRQYARVEMVSLQPHDSS